MDTVTILGATGMLGSACAKVLPNAQLPTRNEFDALKDVPNFSGWVINCIGAIPQRVSQSDLMRKLNTDFPINLSNSNAKVIQIATDCVFSGKHGNYSENSDKDPIDEYGRSKLAGEVAISLKIRCSIIGPDQKNASLFEWVRSQPEGSTLNGYVNHIWNGISTNIFANLAKKIIDTDFWEPSTFHLVPKNSVSKFELVRLIARHIGRDDLIITPVSAQNSINRTLSTNNLEINEYLWQLAGFSEVPTIQEIVEQIPL